MAKVIDLAEWKKNKYEKDMWTKLKSEEYDIDILQDLWEEGKIFIMTTSPQVSGNFIEYTPISGPDDKNFTVE